MKEVVASQKGTRVVTGKVRASFVKVFKPEAMEEGKEEEYSISLIIPKSDTRNLKAIKDAIKEATEEGKSKKFGGKVPANLRSPLRDGDAEKPDFPEYADSYFFNARAKKNRKPGVVDRNMNKLTEEEDFYSGCYCRASVVFYAYDQKGNRGIGAGLNNLQKLEDGERLSGGSSAEDDFDEIEDDMFN